MVTLDQYIAAVHDVGVHTTAVFFLSPPLLSLESQAQRRIGVEWLLLFDANVTYVGCSTLLATAITAEHDAVIERSFPSQAMASINAKALALALAPAWSLAMRHNKLALLLSSPAFAQLLTQNDDDCVINACAVPVEETRCLLLPRGAAWTTPLHNAADCRPPSIASALLELGLLNVDARRCSLVHATGGRSLRRVL